MNRVSKFLADFVMSRAPGADEERGQAAPAAAAPQAAAREPPRSEATQPARPAPAYAAPAAEAPDFLPPEVRDQLRTFRHLIGISTDPSMISGMPMGTVRPGARPAPNVGLYARVVRKEKAAKDGYKYFSYIINGCLGGQIVVAAALTAMGAADTNHNAVTAFGAINTIIAGFLTYLKGSGLPNRLKYFHNEWKRLREYIEQRERDLSRPSGAYLDIYAIVSVIEQMYDETKTDVEVNTPDGYISVFNTRKEPGAKARPGSVVLGTGDGSKSPAASRPDLLRALSSGAKSFQLESRPDLAGAGSFGSKLKGIESTLAEKLHEAESMRNSLAEKLHHVDQARTSAADTLREADHSRQDLTQQAQHARQDLTQQAQHARQDLTQQAQGARQDLTHQAQGLRQDVTAQAQQAQHEAGRELEKGEQTFSARIRELRGSIDGRVQDLTSSIDQSTRGVAHDIESTSTQTSARAREMELSAVEEVSRDIQAHARRKIDELAARLSH